MSEAFKLMLNAGPPIGDPSPCSQALTLVGSSAAPVEGRLALTLGEDTGEAVPEDMPGEPLHAAWHKPYAFHSEHKQQLMPEDIANIHITRLK